MEKILIIDDSPVQASLLASILKDEYDITVANTAQTYRQKKEPSGGWPPATC